MHGVTVKLGPRARPAGSRAALREEVVDPEPVVVAELLLRVRVRVRARVRVRVRVGVGVTWFQ